MCVLLALIDSVLPHSAVAAVVMVDLNAAIEFAVLAGAGITITGPTTISGDLGSYPTPTITGEENLTLNGVNHAGNAIAQQAQLDLTSAYLDAAGRTPTTTYDPIFDLGGLTLSSGVYNNPSSFGLTGTLSLDAEGDPDAVWIFQAGSTLITASYSTVSLIGGAQANRVFWQVGSSATLGTGTDFAGSLLALQSITLNTGATVHGQLLAQNGAVTLDHNTIEIDLASSVPEPGTTLLLGVGLAVSLALRRRFSPPPSHPCARHL